MGLGKVPALAAGGMAVLVLLVLLGGAQVTAAPPPPGGCGTGAPAGATPAAPAGAQQSAALSPEQTAVATQIAGTGKGAGISERGIAIALGVAMQESTLNPRATSPGGLSVGLFQQQGALYAGVNRHDPVSSSAAFYRQLTARVLNYGDPSVPLADAAQRVQASGAGPEWYARWEQWATGLAHQLAAGAGAGGAGSGSGAGSVPCRPGGGSGPIPVTPHGLDVDLPAQAGVPGTVHAPSPQAATALAAGLSYLGTDYAWGGGNPNGPSRGIRDGGVADAHGDYNKVGFDCAGLTQFAWAQARVQLTRPASAQQSAATGTRLPFAQAQPGDLLFYGSSAHHVALYLGQIGPTPMMLEAEQSGTPVHVAPVRTGSDFQQQVVRPA